MSKASMSPEQLKGLEKTKHYKNLEKLCAYYGINKKGYELYQIFAEYEKKIIKQTTNSCNGKGSINGVAYHTGISKKDENNLNNYYVRQGYKSAYLTDDADDDIFEIEAARLSNLLKKEFPNLPFFINYDARGYAIKIESKIVNELFNKGIRIYTDFGGYGILAPNFESEED